MALLENCTNKKVHVGVKPSEVYRRMINVSGNSCMAHSSVVGIWVG